MKSKLYRFTLHGYACIMMGIVASLQLDAQYVIKGGVKTPVENDSVVLYMSNVRGNIQWEISGDLITWKSLSGKTYSNMALHIDSSAYYRAVIREGTCAPVYSDTILIAELYDARDHQFYDVVKIGNQKWMAENLNYDAGDDSWFYNGNPFHGPVYGRLYNWPAAISSCPTDWHLPSDREWMMLENNMGIEMSDVMNAGWRGTGIRNQLVRGGKTGFNLLYGGFRAPEEYFDGFESLSLYWTSGSDDTGLHWYRGFNTTNTGVHRTTYADDYGFSVRCVKNNVPLLFTDSISGISDTSAIVHGTLYDTQGSTVISIGVCWDNQAGPTYNGNHISTSTEDSVFNIHIPYLSTSTTYYMRVYAINASGVGYGNTITFTTQGPVPIIYTTPATSITTTAAQTGGNIANSKGLQITTRGVCWSTHEDPTTSDAKTSNGSGTGSYVSAITGLSANTRYYIRAYIITPAGTFYGDQVELKTLAVNETGTCTDIRDGKTYKTVKIGYQWWMAQNLDIYAMAGSSYYENDSTGYAAGGRLYNAVMAQTVCIPGWHLPSEDEWKLLEATLGMDASELDLTGWRGTDEGAKLFKGAPDGFDAEFSGLKASDGGFYGYNTIAAYWSSTQYESSGEYWYRGINAGRKDIHRDKYSNAYMHSVRCIKNDKPYLVTDSVGSILEFTAEAYTRILSSGGRNITARGVCWNTASSPTISNSHTSDGTGNTPFTSAITGLTQNTKYYLRAYATNDQGTSYGNEISFTTERAIPVVTTAAITTITSTTASSGGNVTDAKGFAITARGVCWSTTPSPAVSGSHTTNGTGSGSFTSSMTGLQPNTKYYARAYATSSAGTGYGNELSFRTTFLYETDSVTDVRDGKVYKIIAIGDQVWMAENLSYQTATGSAFYQNNSAEYGQYGRMYSWDAAMDACPAGWHLPSDTEWKTLEIFMGMDAAAADNNGWRGTNEATRLVEGGTSGFEAKFGGQCYPGEYYANEGEVGTFWSSTQKDGASSWYRGFNIVHSDIHRESYGVDYKFSVRCLKDELPVITTAAVTDISDTSAYSGGNVTYDGGVAISARGVCWGTSHNPTVSGDTTLDGTDTGEFVSFMTGLKPGKTYYVRAYATNPVGTAYGSEAGFTTLTSVPRVTTAVISFITDTTAVSGGNITSDGGLTIVRKGVCWSTLQNPTIANDTTQNGSGTGVFVSLIKRLQPNTTYYVRAYATNSKGTGYGNQVSFSTNSAVPKVTTSAITGITDKAATGGGNVISDGGLTVVSRGVCWSTSHNPTVINNKTQDGSGMGSFVSTLSSLADQTTYYVRAYAANSNGVGYGEEKSFKTLYLKDSITDARDGQVYHTVKIGSEWWLAENMNYSIAGSGYYDDDSTLYADVYGRLYTWTAMMNGAASSEADPSGVQGICPTGWHIPSDAEWNTLIDDWGGASTAGSALKETGTLHWSLNSDATNASGFTARPAGIITDALVSQYLGRRAYFWSATESSETHATRFILTRSDGTVTTEEIVKENLISVRCIKD
jgi:uncharacterized protein (TIGR02145 family)